MVTPISVSITAVDSATKIFQRMNANIERMQAPVKNLQRSFDRFSQLSGMTRLNEGFSRVRGSATSAFHVMGQIAPVLGTITSAVTIAGMTRLATSWANFGSNLQTTSQRLGMSVSGLHSWQNGARLAGVSAESMTAAMGNLQENIWNARGGRNPQFIATLNAMHVAMNNVDGSARSTEAIMNDVSNVIAKVKDPAAQAALATASFGSAGNEMLPFLREGSAGMARYRQEALKYGVMNEAGAKAANQLRLAQARMTLSVEGFGYSLAQSVEPVLTPIIEQTANWIAVNRGWITQNIAGYVQQFSNYLKSINWQQVSTGAQQVWNSIKQFTQTIQENIDKIGGFKTVMEVVAGVLAVKVVGGVMSTIAPFASLGMTVGRMVVPILGSLLAVMTPVGLGIAAAGVVIGGAAAYIYKHWDSFKPYWDKLWTGVKSVFDIYVKGIQTILTPFTGLVGVIQKDWEPLTNFFGGMLDGIQKAFYSAFHYIGGIINKITSAIDKVGNALGLTKQQAEEVSNTMKIQPPSAALYTQNIANDNNPSSQRTSWGINGWFSGDDTGKSKSKSDTEKKIDRMTGQFGVWMSSWTNKVAPEAQVAPAAPASTQKAINHGQVASNVIQMPVVQQAQSVSNKVAANPAFNNTLNGYIQQATQGSSVSEAQMKALIMTESSGRMVGNKTTSAYGYTQLTNAAAKDMGVNKFDPYQNVLGGRKYYEQMLKKVQGNSVAAYGAYHDGGNSKGVKQFLASGGQDLSGFSAEGRKAMMNFQKHLGQAQGGQLQLPNSVIPQGIAANSNTVQATMPRVPNMSNVASVAPITANSGLGQMDGGNGVSIPSAPITLPQAANDGSTPQKLLLEIDIKGKPAGMDIKAKSRSPSLTVESLNYERAMDPIASASGF
ncbi:Soluble lytic murein transglycosylase or regulatory protein s (may contain LysM/invasin domain) (MltE) (PDB:153L) [Commensalibacter communis]|uniref:Soluble lytic murein transglycosylase or regulatory protein s ( may contain LysM/invasin domain) (MltE) n=1 Tax=Commensalibacter communis TaxID=2972786 RepID=A0A9W4XAD4_9PROT|nr:transglycosylase SLT domain-containing protein [Commensalibacter communis]CAI3953438.1 Soluble lytic murein transglycosylase or regulatory protein s (may contain LysM/invasin domain) (MltE) (PDB:153L) [Commensalibacter communis]CAI3956746.1 Soluble lytic murein transglycosylase or regulatory protein s (may contain LysM/invasin domain) (MltE) (PDB:153L) [Commensalibacter communis]